MSFHCPNCNGSGHGTLSPAFGYSVRTCQLCDGRGRIYAWTTERRDAVTKRALRMRDRRRLKIWMAALEKRARDVQIPPNQDK